MQVNPKTFIKIETKSTFLDPSDSPFINTMFFEMDNNGTALAANPEKSRPFISRQIFIHPQSPLGPLPIPSPASSASLNRRRPLLQRGHRHSASTNSYCSGRFAELAGGTAAECAAVCCCCPCGLANLLYLTIYKVPAGLCRRALRRKRRKQLIKKGLLQPRTERCRCGFGDTELQIHTATGFHDCGDLLKSDEEDLSDEEDEEEMLKLEKEMWETFYGTGFWRSPSQREPQVLEVMPK